MAIPRPGAMAQLKSWVTGPQSSLNNDPYPNMPAGAMSTARIRPGEVAIVISPSLVRLDGSCVMLLTSEGYGWFASAWLSFFG